LRNKLVYFGLTLLLVGVVCLTVGEVNLANRKNVTIGQRYLVWSYSCNLTGGGSYGVQIESSQDWSTPFASEGQNPLPVNVTITSPDGGVTHLQAFYWGAPASGLYKEGTPPTIQYVTYENVDDASLTVDSASPKIRFTVKQSGPYTVTVLQEGLWSTQPPAYILFFEAVVSNGETYSLLASGGGVLGILGGVTFAVGVLGSGGKKRRRAR
jgi:hypothetical protein